MQHSAAKWRRYNLQKTTCQLPNHVRADTAFNEFSTGRCMPFCYLDSVLGDLTLAVLTPSPVGLVNPAHFTLIPPSPTCCPDPPRIGLQTPAC